MDTGSQMDEKFVNNKSENSDGGEDGQSENKSLIRMSEDDCYTRKRKG